ncbi:hypothetical protein Meda_104 [Salmonella phage Meda]|uniref:Uncharacterized protein n=1 Tax=Salmonella phage Meda TaxID=2283282 RepID=A0A385IS76_9CAUD|nr:hypothetical protein Meda_104 [Salmonella phage Meda]
MKSLQSYVKEVIKLLQSYVNASPFNISLTIH